MNKRFQLTVALAFLAVGTSMAQSTEAPKRSEAKAVQATPAEAQRLQNATRINAAATTDKSQIKQHKPSQEQVNAGIARLEQLIKEQEGKEGFNREAYDKRLTYLRSLYPVQSK